MNFRFPQIEPRRGQSLVEFALVALVVYLLMAAIITFGFALFAAQTNQQVVDVAAREISRTPIPLQFAATGGTIKLEDVLYGNANANPELTDVRSRVFDEHYLALDVTGMDATGIRTLIGQLPVVNQMLTTLMFVDEVDGQQIMRYPGTLINDTESSDDPTGPSPSGFLVRIAATDGRHADVIDWVRAFEPLSEDDRTGAANPGPYELTSADRGVVSLRLNYPFQSAVMSSFRNDPDADDYPFDETIGRRNTVAGAQVVPLPNNATAAPIDRTTGPYAGDIGLGSQGAFAEEVRPFTKLIVNQAVYRREVFR